MYETLLLDSPADHVQRMTLNRPDRMNAMNTRMGEEMREFFRQFDVHQEPDIRVLILTGAGDKAFSAGADLKERQGMSDLTWRKQHVVFEEMLDLMQRFPIPIIVAVNGVAVGGGCEMAITCDLIVAADHSRFGQPEVKRGIMPGGGGTQRLPRRIGISRAKDMVYTGRIISAQEAFDWGLVNRLVPADRLMEETLELARTIAANGPIPVRQAKKAINWGSDLSIEAGLVLEIEAYNVVVPTEDRREGIDAFNEKRDPVFKNR